MISGFNAPGAGGAEDESVAADMTRGLRETGHPSAVLSPAGSSDGSPELGSYVNNSTFFKGVIESSRSIGIDGKFEGEIHSEADVVIGRDAEVRGHIHGETVIIAGKVIGNIAASMLELQPSAHLLGNIRTGSLLVGLGAVYRGQCSMGAEEPPDEAPAASTEQPSHSGSRRRRSAEPEPETETTEPEPEPSAELP